MGNIYSILNPPKGNDLPEQGGITGQLPMPQAGNIDQFDMSSVPQASIQIGPQSEEINALPDIDYHKRMLELYKPEHTDSDRLNEIVSRMPQRNKPGIMRKIAAGLSGLTGDMRNVDRALYGPYYNQIADWKEQYEPAKDLAQEERLGNNNLRMMANSMLSQEMSDRRFEQTAARHKVLQGNSDRRLDQGDTKIDQGQQRIDLATKGFDLKKELAEGGQVITDNKTGNTYLMNRKGELSELPFDQLSFEDKEIIKANQSIRAANAKPKSTGANQRDRLQLKVNADGTHTVINLDKEVSKPVKTETGEMSKAPTTELDRNRALSAKALQVKSSNPDWEKWITFDKTGKNFTGIKDKSWLGDPDTYKKIYQAIYGVMPPDKSNQTINPNNTKLPEDKIAVIRTKDKKKFMIPMNRLSDYLANGYVKAN